MENRKHLMIRPPDLRDVVFWIATALITIGTLKAQGIWPAATALGICFIGALWITR